MKIPDWATATTYEVDDVVVVKNEQPQFNDKIYRCLLDHTSVTFATEFGNGRWELIQTAGIQGPQGDQGTPGGQGIQGPAGANGANGAPGNDGVFSEIASQGEAQAGVENTKGMTSLRTAQAITSQLPGHATIVQMQNDIDAAEADIAQINTRVTILEGLTPPDVAFGKQRLKNNFANQDLQGADLPGEDGKGNRFELNSEGARSARVHCEIYRKDDAETRFTTCVLLLHFIPSLLQWRVERESTTAIVGDPDGITFDVVTTQPSPGIYVGQVRYSTDNMAGGNYDIDSYVKWLIKEISDTF